MNSEIMNSPNREIYQKIEARFGFSWVPLMMTGPSAGKRPIEQDWQRWCEERYPYLAVDHHTGNLGIATGPASRIIVLDVDDIEKFKKFCRKNGLDMPETFLVKTGSGGKHYYYLYPTDGNRYGNRSSSKNGFDVRGIGGQVVAPGSWHVKSGRYYEIENFVDIAEAPEWLKEYSLTGVLPGQKKEPPTTTPPSDATGDKFTWDGAISNLPIKPETKGLIQFGVPEGGRSEVMMTVLNALVWANLSDSEILTIFEAEAIGEKYREKGRSREKWLQPQIDKARSFVTDRADTHMFNDYVSESISKVLLPGAGVKINDVGKTLGKLMAAKFFTRNGEIVEVS